jgi:hypothetical protein
MVMRDKRGWLRIFEAIIAIMLILGSLLLMHRSQETTYTEYEYVVDWQVEILNSIASDPFLRYGILENDTKFINNFLVENSPSNMHVGIKICNLTGPCPIEGIIDQDFFVQERIISGTISPVAIYSPKRIRLFGWKRTSKDDDFKCVDRCVEGAKKCLEDEVFECVIEDGCPVWNLSETCVSPKICIGRLSLDHDPFKVRCDVEEEDVEPEIAELEANYNNLRINEGVPPSCVTGSNINWAYFNTILNERGNYLGINITKRQKCYYPDGFDSWCDDIRLEPSMFIDPYIAPGGFIERENNYVCLIQGYNYTVIETFWGIDDNSNVIENSYTFIVDFQ